MSATPALGEFGQMALRAILHLDGRAYAVTIGEEIQDCTDREPAPRALPTPLAHRADPTPQMWGRRCSPALPACPGPAQAAGAKRHFRASTILVEAVAPAQRAYRRLMQAPKFPGVANA